MIIRSFLILTCIQLSLISMCIASGPFEEEDGIVYAVGGNPVTVSQLKTLSSNTLGLDITDQFFENPDLKEISVYFRNLKTLKIGNNRFNDEGTSHIGTMTSLESLDMHYNKVTGLGIAALAPLTQLRTLVAKSLYLGNEGIEVLCRTLPWLTTLDVRACGFNETALPFFKNLFGLKSINLSNNPVNPEVLRAFEAWAKENNITIIK